MDMKLIRPDTRSTGTTHEEYAKEFLQSGGLKPLVSNFYSRFGEIDLIMLDHTTLVFIEVKYRNNSSFGTAIASVTRPKQKKIIKTARFFLSQNKKYNEWNCRFDVIGIDEKQDGKKHIHWIKNAFME